MKRVRKSRPKAIQDDDDEVEWDQDQLQGSGDDDDGSAYEVRLHSRTIYAVRAPIAVHRFHVHTLQQYQVLLYCLICARFLNLNMIMMVWCGMRNLVGLELQE